MVSQPQNYYLGRAYAILFSRKPENLEQWQIAKEFVEKFDGRLFVDDRGKELVACMALALIIEYGYVFFPAGTGCEDIVRRAIGLLAELDSRLADVDFGAGLAGHLLRQYETALSCVEPPH